jgi:putative addiction module component (TIGR02574 family)
MNATTEQLLPTLLALPEGERLELIEALITSLQPSDRAPFDASWGEVVRRRSAELTLGKATAAPWTEVKRQAREKAGG